MPTPSTATSGQTRHRIDGDFASGIARAFGGAIFFSIPLFMTMEMWWMGFFMSRFRLAIFLLWMMPLLTALDHYAGFQETSTWAEDALDALVAYAVGFVTSFAMLLLFNIVHFDLDIREIVGKVAVQAVPAAFGAVLAISQFGGSADEGRSGGDEEMGKMQKQKQSKKRNAGYHEEILFMATGAIFLAMNVAPTEEVMVIAAKTDEWHALAMVIAGLLLTHAFVYAADFRGAPSAPEGTPWWSLFLRFTLVSYAVALLVCVYVLWTFGRFEGEGVRTMVHLSVVLALPASLGASAARLIL